MIKGTGESFKFFRNGQGDGRDHEHGCNIVDKGGDQTCKKHDSARIAHFTLGIRSMMASARRDGIFDSMKKNTMPIVPAIIKITFQSMAVQHLSGRQNTENHENGRRGNGDERPVFRQSDEKRVCQKK